MPNDNSTLPDNLQQLIQTLNRRQAVPLGTLQEIPFLALKLANAHEALLQGDIHCDIKPTFCNIDHKDETLALCFVQLRLNGRGDLIYTTVYDLTNEKHFHDCYALMQITPYGLLIASEHEHDFQVFETPFDAPFSPREVLTQTRDNTTAPNAEAFGMAANALYRTKEHDAELWEYFESIAPLEQQWYVRMPMTLTPND